MGNSFFMPDYYVEDLLRVDWDFFRSQGIRHIFLDIDNTLEVQGTRAAGPRTQAICAAIFAADLDLSVLSNAEAARAQAFCTPLNLRYLGQAAKPLTFRLTEYLKQLELEPAQVLLVGDQVFTDLLCGKFLPCPVLMVQSLGGKEGFFLRLKRRLEKLLVILGCDPRRAPRPPLRDREGEVLQT